MNTKCSAVNWHPSISFPQFLLCGFHYRSPLFACVRLFANLPGIHWYAVDFCAWQGPDLLSIVKEDYQSHTVLVNLSLAARICLVRLGQLQAHFNYFCLKVKISLFVPRQTYAPSLGRQGRIPSSGLHHIVPIDHCPPPFLLQSSVSKSHLFEVSYVSKTIHFPVIAVCPFR